MNRGVVQSSPVQQMIAGNPNWWNINHNMRPPISHQQPPSSSPFFFSPSSNNFLSPHPPSSPLPFPSNWHANQDQLPESWSQLLMGEEDKKLGNWEEQVLMSQAQNVALVDVKQESSSVNSYVYGGGHGGGSGGSGNNSNEEFQAASGGRGGAANWSHHHQIVPPPHPPAASSSSPKSCVTTFSSNMLDFSSSKTDARHPPPDRSSEYNSNGGGGAVKKARVQPSTTQSSTFKVRKEKLGDRITALHQLVSPFGKTDTASVLLEAIGYIRFLQSQIEALSLPYLGTTGSSSSNMRQQHSVQGEKNCIFPEDSGQELQEEAKKDLKSRGLCLVPVSCTLQVGSDNGADYWAPALGGGFR
ncbi:transcription factor bHLH68 [Neltuma alba]|uniref:transcription factor bHLH68 n=1 Tax=Neltuma alba TaxID=207710 RepID=UPI0010A476CF|nr:transcription factor bHLH68-like [Prosopis alba]